MQPLVTVIVPVYNAAPHLARCIESVRRQSYKNLEILLVNDGSHDTSLEICRMYAGVDKRIRVLDKPNSGVSATRNLAIGLAKGEYLQFVDSDDYLSPNATELLVDRALATASDLVIAHYWRVRPEEDESSEPGMMARLLPRRPALKVIGFLDSQQPMDTRTFARHLMDEPASFYYGVMWNKLYRADIIRENGIRCNTELAWSEDLLFNLEYIRYAQRFCGIDTPIYYYINNKGSLVHTQLNLPNIVRTRTKLFSYYRDLYERLGLYEQYKLQIHKYLISIAEHV